MHNITLIKGDGIGPEISDASLKIIDAAGVDIIGISKQPERMLLRKKVFRCPKGFGFG